MNSVLPVSVAVSEESVKSHFTTAPDRSPIERARAEWQASGVSQEIIEANVTVIEGNAVIEALNLSERISDKSGTFVTTGGAATLANLATVIEGGGWRVTGLEPEAGFSKRSEWGKVKPWNPRPKHGKDGIQKYEQPWGTDARAVFLEVPSKPDLWATVATNPSQTIYITEGEKKAGLLLSLGYPAISVSGIWNATKKNENGVHQLIPDLKRFAQKGRQVFFVYDSEGVPRKDANVYAALKTAGRCFQADGAAVAWVAWPAELGKGIDDVWSSHGADKVHEILSSPRTLKSYEEQLYCVTKSVDQHVFESFFEKGRGDWAVINQAFYRYTGEGYWKHIEDTTVQKNLAAYLMQCYRPQGKDAIPCYNVASDKALSSAFKFALKALAAEAPRNQKLALRVFTNGTLNTETGELHEHRKEDFLTSRIDSPYHPDRPCPAVFERFIESSFGLENLPLVRAVISMLLDTSAPWGYFLYILGQSGGGKGTLTRFIELLFDSDNVRSGNSFEDVSKPETRHQTLKGTALYCFPDMGGHVKGVRAFYELVDNGPMMARALFSSVTYQEKFNTRFIVASVEPLTIENAGDGWERRAIVLPVRPGKRDKDHNLEKKLALCKADVISWALAMPKDERNHLLMNSAEASESAAEAKRSVTMSGDSVRQFIDLCLRPAKSGQGATLAELHDWYRVFAKSFGYSDMGASRLGARLQSILPNHYEPRRKVRADEPGYVPNKFIPAQYNVADISGVFSVTEMGLLTINKLACSEGGINQFIPVDDSDIINALNRCSSWATYSGIVERFSQAKVNELWPQLSTETQSKILGFQNTTAPAPAHSETAPEPEPGDSEPRLTPGEVDQFVGILAEVIAARDVPSMADFVALPAVQKYQIAERLTKEQVAIVSELSREFKASQPTTVRDWVGIHGGIEAAMAKLEDF